MAPETEKVIQCMFAMQRYPWEQGVCGQALCGGVIGQRHKLEECPKNRITKHKGGIQHGISGTDYRAPQHQKI